MPLLARVALIVLLLAPAADLRALPEDAEQPIEIEADTAELDETNGVATYAGDARVRQGTLEIRAGRVRIETVDEQVTRIVAEGPWLDRDRPEGSREQDPSFRQQIAAGDPTDPRNLLEGNADRIVYSAPESEVRFLGDARMDQGPRRLIAAQLSARSLPDGEVRLEAEGDEERASFVDRLLLEGEGVAREVTGRAARMRYLTDRQVLDLEGDAEIAQGEERFAGRELRYDIARGRVEAAGGGEDGRMSFTISPARLREPRDGAPDR